MRPATTSDSLESFAEVVTALKRGLGRQLVALVLFGSRARGDADEESDWDLLLIAHDLPPGTLDRHFLMKRIIPIPWRAQTAILAKTPTEFEALIPDLYLDIALDGIILFDTDGYMTKRLAGLRLLIQEQGLYREQFQKELTWHWRQFPGHNWSFTWKMAE